MPSVCMGIQLFFSRLVSPYEWSFPYAQWVTDRMNSVGATPTKLGALGTLNIYNVLNEIINSYITGNSKKASWKTNAIFKHETSDGLAENAGKRFELSTDLLFYRFEFQDQLTMHMHCLIWLKKKHSSFLDDNDCRANLPLHNTCIPL